jgi:hypothetical protein
LDALDQLDEQIGTRRFQIRFPSQDGMTIETDYEETQAKLKQLLLEEEAQINVILTIDQRQKFEELQGPPFDFRVFRLDLSAL